MGLIARFSEQASKITDVKSAHSDATPAKPPSERQFDAPVCGRIELVFLGNRVGVSRIRH